MEHYISKIKKEFLAYIKDNNAYILLLGAIAVIAVFIFMILPKLSKSSTHHSYKDVQNYSPGNTHKGNQENISSSPHYWFIDK